MKRIFEGKTKISSITALWTIVIAVLFYLLLDDEPIFYSEWSTFAKRLFPITAGLVAISPLFGLVTAPFATTKGWKIALILIHVVFCLLLMPLVFFVAMFVYATAGF